MLQVRMLLIWHRKITFWLKQDLTDSRKVFYGYGFRFEVINQIKIKMKKIKILSLLIALIGLLSCSETENITTCGTHNGEVLKLGPEGGCYYINNNENKVYVDRSECNC